MIWMMKLPSPRINWLTPRKRWPTRSRVRYWKGLRLNESRNDRSRAGSGFRLLRAAAGSTGEIGERRKRAGRSLDLVEVGQLRDFGRWARLSDQQACAPVVSQAI